jgi:hypothetical protein
MFDKCDFLSLTFCNLVGFQLYCDVQTSNSVIDMLYCDVQTSNSVLDIAIKFCNLVGFLLYCDLQTSSSVKEKASQRLWECRPYGRKRKRAVKSKVCLERVKKHVRKIRQRRH